MGRGNYPRCTQKKIVVIIILVTMLITFPILNSSDSSADPTIEDNFDGTKTAKWNFQNSGDYSVRNVTVGSGEAKLNLTDGSWFETTSSQFSAGTTDANATITSDDITLLGNETDLIKNNNFTTSGDWDYTNSPDGNISANWKGSSETGRFKHESGEIISQFDSMDDVLSNWSMDGSGGTISIVDQEFSEKVEGLGSLVNDIDLNGDPSRWAGVTRGPAFWDWSPYNRLGMWIYNESVTGTGSLNVYINITDQDLISWSSPNQTVLPSSGWYQYFFDISNFIGNLSKVMIIDIRFTNITDTAKLYIDDIQLYNYKTYDQTACINQTFSKDNITDPTPTHVVMTFDYSVSNYTSVLESDMSIWINDTDLLWSLDITNTYPWTSVYLDVSPNMTSQGQYNLSIRFHLKINTPFEVGFLADVDNVSIKAPNYKNGTFVSQTYNVLTGAIWNNISWSEEEPPGTNISVQIRRADTQPNLLITAWEAPLYDSALKSIQGVNTSWIQYRINLNTANATRTPNFKEITISYQNYSEEGYVVTKDFTPPETFLGWRTFNATSSEPPGTSITYWYFNNSGSFWTQVWPGDNLSGAPLPPIKFRANLTTTNTTLTSVLTELNITYGFIGILDHIHMSLASWMGTTDDSVDINATGHDTSHNIVGFTIYWNTTDPKGNVNSTGFYSPGSPGTWRVYANNSDNSISNFTDVFISVGALEHIHMSLASWIGTTDDSVDIDAIGHDADHNIVTFTTYWNATDPKGIVDLNGVYNPGSPGAWRVYANNSDNTISNFTDVTVSLGALDHIHMSLSTWSGTTDESVDIDATGHDADHNVITFTMYWNTTDPKGNVDLNGVYNPGSPGTWRVYANNSDNTISNFTEVFISLGALDHIHMSVSTWSGTTDEFIDIDAIGHDADHNAVTFTTYWNETDPKGVVDLNGVYNPGSPGTWRVYANNSDNTIWNFTEVFISVGSLDHIHMSISTWSGTTDEFIDISAVGHDADHNIVSFTANWSTDDPKGTVDPTGHYEPGKNGTWFVWCNDSANPSISNYTTVTISLGNLAHIIIDPLNPGNLHIGDTVDFSVYGYDSDYNSLGAVSVYWSITGNAIGTITPLGLSETAQFTATALGTGRVKADDGLVLVNYTMEFSVVNEPPTISGQIQDQIKPEDYGSWDLNLTGYASDDMPISNLKWYISGADDQLYSIKGNNITGNHVLNFTTVTDANGDSLVTVWLVDEYGASASQAMWINITPVNDAPTFTQPPNLIVKAGEDYPFDYSLYIEDIDNVLGALELIADSEYIDVDGLSATFNYPGTMIDENVTVVLKVTDGEYETNVTFSISIISSGGQSGINITRDVILPVGLGVLGLMAVLLTLFVALPMLRKKKQKYAVEDLFLVHKDGRLISHKTKQLKADRDEDILSGMLTAVQEFIKDSMGRDEQLKVFEFQEKKVMIERGEYVYLAVFLAGEEPPNAREQLVAFVEDVEEAYKYILPQWTGELEAFRGLQDLMDRLFEGRGYQKGYWKKLKYIGV